MSVSIVDVSVELSEGTSDLKQELIRQRFAAPPYHISIHLGQANDVTLRRLLCRYNRPMDNGTFTRRINGAEVNVKLYRCPTNLIPVDVPSVKFVVCVASGGGLSESVLIASLPRTQVYKVWRGPQEGWASTDLIIKSFNKPIIKRKDSVLRAGMDDDQLGMPEEKFLLAANIEKAMAAKWEHDIGDYAQTHSASSRNPDRNNARLQPLITRAGYDSHREVEKHVAPGYAFRSEAGDGNSDPSSEDYNNIDWEVGKQNTLSWKRPRTFAYYARPLESQSDEQVLKKQKSSDGRRNSGLIAVPATVKHSIRDQSFYPSAPCSEPTRPLMTPAPTVNRRSTSYPVQHETNEAPVIVNRGPEVLSGSEKRARTTLCFLRASSDASLNFQLSVADSIEKFFKLAEIAHTIRPGEDTAALSAQVPGVETAVDLLLFARYGFAELLEKIESSGCWEDAGEEGQCMVEVREFGKAT